MKWIKYEYICGVNPEDGSDVLAKKRIGYSEANLIIAQDEAYNGEYTIEDDGREYPSSATIPADANMQGNKITNLGDPVENTDAANLGSVKKEVTRRVDEVLAGADFETGVSYNKAQALNDMQKKTARNNIGAASADDVPPVTQNLGDNEGQVMSQAAVKRAIETLTALPYGGSREWLNANGDKSKLYQIDGYTWGYLETNGWTQSNVQFNVVSKESEMINAGGIPYILRANGEGTVYAYHEASGDIGIPVYSTLPTTATEGQVVAKGGRKYKASLSTKVTEHNGYNASTASFNTRVNSSLQEKTQNGALLTDYIHQPNNADCVMTIKGISKLVKCYELFFKIIFYDANKTALGSVDWSYVCVEGHTQTQLSVLGFDGTLPVSFHPYIYNRDEKYPTAEYIRVQLGITANTAISAADVQGLVVNVSTLNKTETVVNWTDIGAYTEPIQAGWSATSETYDVIDSLTYAADNGDTAVYSANGYLYTYNVGFGWFQMSKYNAPTIGIDGELSETSTNAIQNKVVVEEFNFVKAQLNSSSKELDNINLRMTELETGNGSLTVPTFWQAAVDECIAKIKALQVGRNCVTFPFFSDNHQRNGYAGLLIAYIMKECHIPYCFFGGDSISNGYIDSEETMIQQDAAFDISMSHILNGKFCRAVGNHDGYANASAATGDEIYYTRDQVYELFFREESVAQNKHFGGDGTYYYVDDIPSKTRFVVLNTNKQVVNNAPVGNSVDEEQLSWLRNTALSFNESGWAAVFFSHHPISNHYHAYVSNAATVREIIKNYINGAVANKADIAGWYSGHIHRDRIWTGVAVNTSDDSQGEAMGFTQVTITSDHTSIAYDDATKHNIGPDDQSHAIDFVTINKNARTVNITRLGVGEDRSYTY